MYHHQSLENDDSSDVSTFIFTFLTANYQSNTECVITSSLQKLLVLFLKKSGSILKSIISHHDHAAVVLYFILKQIKS